MGVWDGGVLEGLEERLGGLGLRAVMVLGVGTAWCFLVGEGEAVLFGCLGCFLDLPMSLSL